MSAICGFWLLHGDFQPAAMAFRMIDALGPHGPDRASHRQIPSYPIGLGHRLLAITPEDALESQPLHRSSLWLVADARIDNRAELADSLAIPASEAATLPDSAFILRAWQHWGRDCVQHLIGSFAFALWDGHAEQFFLARDHSGDRPLYFRKTSDSFAFATTARALRALPGVSSDLDERQLVRDLMGLPPDPTRTRFREISSIAAGHFVVVDRTSATSHRYWQVASLAPVRFARDDDYSAAFLHIFDEAVRCRLRTNGGIATELSAGLDSGAVASSAARLLATAGAPLLAYTAVPCPEFSGLVPRGYIADEGPYAAQVAALYPNIRHELVDASASDMLRELDRVFPLLDIPHAAALNSVWSHLIMDLAQAAGVKVLLAGSLGNFAFSYSGADILHNLYRSRRYLTLLRTAWHLRSIGLSSGRNAASLTVFASLPWALRRRIDPLIRSMGVGWTALRPGPAAEHDALDQLRRHHHTRDTALPHVMESQFQRNQYGDYNAAASAGWQLDVRDPTADKRVFEFCAAIPPEQFLVGGQGRSLVRRAMRGRLPQSTLDRSEKGTQAADWYESLGKIRTGLIRELALEQRSPIASRLIDLDQLRSALEAWPATAADAMEQHGLYQSALPRGMAVAYFIRRIEAERLSPADVTRASRLR